MPRRVFIESDDDDAIPMDVDEPGPSQRRVRKAKTGKSKSTQEVEEQSRDQLFEKYQDVEFTNRAMSVALSLANRGMFKENELKPFLTRKGSRSDWQEGLRMVQDNMEHLFGLSLVHSGATHQFIVRNNLIKETAAVYGLFEGKLNRERIDDGGYVVRNILKNDPDEAYLFPVLTLIMMSGGNKQVDWTVSGESLQDFMMDKLEVNEATMKKLITGGKTAVFVKEGWIRQTVKELDGVEPMYSYFWGPRAIATISAARLLEKYCLITGVPKANFASFMQQLKEIDLKNDMK
uniref:MAGE domain-containing protein n=1 Tax=Panagrolaimus sp. JU765 TaxID=591449 RepID=A0AC34QBL8_9BILA